MSTNPWLSLPEFIVRARKAPVDPDRFLAAVGGEGRVEYLAHMIVNALLVSKGHREDTRLTLVLEDSKDYSRALTFDGASLGSLSGTNEQAMLQACAGALHESKGMGKEEVRTVDRGIVVETVSFEHLVKQKVTNSRVYMMDRKGADIREALFDEDPVFLLTDHIPMPKKTFNSLARLGVTKVSLGPVVLHASQCISVIHNELDRLGLSG